MQRLLCWRKQNRATRGPQTDESPTKSSEEQRWQITECETPKNHQRSAKYSTCCLIRIGNQSYLWKLIKKRFVRFFLFPSRSSVAEWRHVDRRSCCPQSRVWWGAEGAVNRRPIVWFAESKIENKRRAAKGNSMDNEWRWVGEGRWGGICNKHVPRMSADWDGNVIKF